MLRLISYCFIGFFSFHCCATAAPSEADRTKQPMLEQSVNKEPAGKKTYERYCVACHGSGLVGAPKFHDDKDWGPRLSEKTIQDLVASAIKGLNAMPTKGTCYECTEDDIKAAIEYMLPQS